MPAVISLCIDDGEPNPIGTVHTAAPHELAALLRAAADYLDPPTRRVPPPIPPYDPGTDGTTYVG